MRVYDVGGVSDAELIQSKPKTPARVAPHQRDNNTSAPVGAPPTPPGGWTRKEKREPGRSTRRGNEEDCAV